MKTEDQAAGAPAPAPPEPVGGQAPGGPVQPNPQDRLPLAPLIPETAPELLEEAERVVADLADRFPNNPDAHEMGARFHFEFGQVDEAVAAWHKCLDLNANYAYAHIGLAKAATGRGDHAEAVAWCRRAVLADPGRVSHHIDLGQALVTAGEIDEALDVLQAVVKSAPTSARGHAELGAAQLQKRDYEAAKGSFETALRLNPTYATAHFGLATACARLGLVQEAQQHEEKFREFRSERHQELRGQRAAYDDDRALREDIAQRYTEVAAVYLAESRSALAEQLWRRATRLDETNVESRQALAWLLVGQDKLRETIVMLGELARLEPANPSYPAEIARLYGRLGRLDEAERTLQEFGQSSPESAAGQAALADFYLSVRKEPSRAVEHAKRAADLSGSPQHWFLLSAAHEVAGDVQAAVFALERAAELAPENAQYRQLLALTKGRAANQPAGAALPAAGPNSEPATPESDQ